MTQIRDWDEAIAEIERQDAEIAALRAEIARLRGVLRYVLDDEVNLLPRASSSCRKVVSAALAEGKK